MSMHMSDGTVDRMRGSLAATLPNETVVDAVAGERAKWTQWLARTNYGIDYASTPDPPCTIDELAAAYTVVEADQQMPAHEWAWCIQMNTGAFPDSDPAYPWDD